MCILDIVLSVVGTIKGFESFETFFECVGSLGASEWGSRPERFECPDGSGLVGNERKSGPARRRCGNMGGAQGLKVGKVVQFYYSIMSYRLICLNKK